MRRLICIIFLAITGLLLPAQDVDVRTWLDTSKIYIGDQVYYNVQVDQPAGLQLTLKRELDTLVDLVSILGTRGPDTTLIDEGRIRISSAYLITSFDSGSYDIPPFFAEIDSSGKVMRFYSDYAHLDVMRTEITPSDSTDVIFDIIGPLRERITAGELVPWILLSLFVALIAVIVVRRIRAGKSSTSDGDQQKIPGEPIHIIILRELDKLERMELWQKGEVKEFYSRLTEILRNFIELKYGIYSLEMTTSETLDAIVKYGIERDQNYERLQEILTTADLSKFAKYVPVIKVNEGMVDLARMYVRTSCRVQEHSSPVENEIKKEGKEVTNE